MVIMEQVADPRGLVTKAARSVRPAAGIDQGESMAISDILASIDSEIAELQQARALLGGGAKPAAKKAVGRPKKAASAPKKVTVVAPAATKPAKKKKRNISPEGRKRIAEAVKRRWAAQKATGAK
jgi:hypothetical protein